MITFHEVTKSFGNRTVLDGVSFTVNPGEFVCITGPSGVGKSTLAHLFIRAELPTRGTVEVDGKNLAKLPRPVLQLYRRRTGVVFQDYKLLSDRTVYENIAFPLEACGDSDAYIRARVPVVLEKVGLSARKDAYPGQLSGGEKARAALGRALAHNPMIVIADEPTGNIDPRQSMEILGLLKQVNAEGVTVILATHDNVLVDALQTRVLRLENGKIVRDAVGGYEAGAGVEPRSSERKSHRLFEEQAVPARAVSPKKQGNDSSKGGGTSVRPIAI